MTPLRCTYAGYQEGCTVVDPVTWHVKTIAGFHLWTLLEPIPNHPFESTVAESTIREAGFEPVEQKEEPC